MDLDLQIERIWGNLAVDIEDAEQDHRGGDSDSDMSDLSSGGYIADVDSSDSEEAPPDAQDPEKDEDELWQQLYEELSAIADDQKECNRPQE